MKSIKQFIFYGKDDNRNFPKDFDDWKYDLFKKYGAVSHLGIQGEPGVLFCLNGAPDDEAISIGGTGVYEIDLNGVGYISHLRFLEDNLQNHYPTNLTSPRRLIVDIVHEEVE